MAPRPIRRRAARPLLLALCVIVIAAPADALALTSSFGPVANNPANKLLRLPMDRYAYDRATGCAKSPPPGVLGLQKWLKHRPRGSSWGIVRCSRLGSGWSLHAEGRAIDWRLDAHSRADRAEASNLMRLLLATDREGNRHALARRMGIQEIIWNCEAWWGGTGTHRYSACSRSGVDDTTAHRDHMHIGMNRAGAAKRTTWWTRRR